MPDSDGLDRIHRRYVEQAAWTADLRQRLLTRLGAEATLVLEVGAGTGAIAAQVATTGRTVFALDLDLGACIFGRKIAPRARWHCADAHALPLRASSLDAVLFHYVLLWLEDPALALSEAARVTRPGGWILAMAEPDHAARLDFPDLLARLGDRQTEALAAQGADVRIGRKLRGLFAMSGLIDVTTGVWGSNSGRLVLPLTSGRRCGRTWGVPCRPATWTCWRTTMTTPGSAVNGSYSCQRSTRWAGSASPRPETGFPHNQKPGFLKKPGFSSSVSRVQFLEFTSTEGSHVVFEPRRR
jgi:SAM-dependent methyltransferase